jgi:hypothetical protein
MRSLVALAAAAVLCGSAAAAGPAVNLVHAFGAQLPKVRRTKVAVLLPASLPRLDRSKVYATGSAGKAGWELDLAYAPRCGGADACFLAEFAGRRRGKLPGKPNVRLAAGDPAFFEASRCGASCAPASLWFIHGGDLYSWQDKDVGAGAKSLLVRLADEAIAAGPR